MLTSVWLTMLVGLHVVAQGESAQTADSLLVKFRRKISSITLVTRCKKQGYKGTKLMRLQIGAFITLMLEKVLFW